MKIAVIGASKGVGASTVKRALDRGHHVVALSRSQGKLPQNDRLTQVLGNAKNKDDVQLAISDADAIIVTLGTGKSTKETTLFSDFSRTLVELNNEKEIQAPVIVLTGFGAGDSWDYNGFFAKTFFSVMLKKVYKDKDIMEKVIADSNMKWMIVRPGLLTNKKLTEDYRVETELKKGMKIKSIPRADVADFMVKQAEEPTMIGKFPALTGK